MHCYQQVLHAALAPVLAEASAATEAWLSRKQSADDGAFEEGWWNIGRVRWDAGLLRAEEQTQPTSVQSRGKSTARKLCGRYATVTVLDANDGSGVEYAERGSHDEVRLAPRSQLVARNSIVLVPNLVSHTECVALVCEVDSRYDEAWHRPEGVTPLERYPIGTLSELAQATFETILRERLLPFISAELPAVEAAIRARSQVSEASRSKPLCGLDFKYSDNEPAINRYSEGGQFDAHTDNHALTINVLLDADVDAFRGGGTEFWREHASASAICGDDSGAPSDASQNEPRGAVVRVEPTAGVGVVFNGSVRHCGRVVTRGVRHLLVASFNIDPARI